MTRLALALAALTLAGPAMAQDATVAKVKGPVFVFSDDAPKPVPAKVGANLISGDTVKVGRGGVAQLLLGQRGAVLLREETELKLDGTERNTTLDVRFGEFLIGLRHPLRGRESFRVATPACVAAVRGTLFWGRYDRKEKSTTYAGFGHTIAVTAFGKTVVVGPGQTVVVPFGQGPSEPKPSTVGLDYAQKFAVDGTLQGLENLAEAPKKDEE